MTTKAMKGINLNSKNARKQIQRVLQNALKDAFASAVAQYAPRVVEMADDNREFTQFTGNTVSSYMAGVYKDRELIHTSYDGSAPVVHDKIEEGEMVYLDNPVEGEPRHTTGAVDIVVRPHGTDLSRKMLSEESPMGGTGMVMTTGTEYSEIVEAQGYDVLTYTFNEVSNNARDDLQRIIRSQER